MMVKVTAEELRELAVKYDLLASEADSQDDARAHLIARRALLYLADVLTVRDESTPGKTLHLVFNV